MTTHRTLEGEPAVLLFRGRGMMSAAIRWQTRSPYSHAALLLADGRHIIEAWQGAGVRMKLMEDWRGVERFAVAGMDSSRWAEAIAFATAHVGAGYDYWAIVRFVSRARMPDNERWFCSELVFAALAHAGVRLFERIEPWAVSPGLMSISPLLRRAEI